MPLQSDASWNSSSKTIHEFMSYVVHFLRVPFLEVDGGWVLSDGISEDHLGASSIDGRQEGIVFQSFTKGFPSAAAHDTVVGFIDYRPVRVFPVQVIPS